MARCCGSCDIDEEELVLRGGRLLVLPRSVFAVVVVLECSEVVLRHLAIVQEKSLVRFLGSADLEEVRIAASRETA